MMKRILFFIGFFTGISLAGYSQDLAPKAGGTLEAYKIGYLTRKLNLSTDEAQKFWPLYNKYMDEIKQVRPNNRKLGEIDLEERIVNIRKKYKTEFSTALPEERVNQFFKEDKEFNNMVRKELQDRQQMRQLRQQQNRRPFSQ
jgi:hypothetical protein